MTTWVRAGVVMFGASTLACGGGSVATSARSAPPAPARRSTAKAPPPAANPPGPRPLVALTSCHQYATGEPDALTDVIHDIPVRGGTVGVAASPPRLRKRPVVVGSGPVGFSRALIQRYMRRSRAQIKYCYEKQLVVNPGLSGRVTVAFTINAQGLVVVAKASGLHPKVDRCIANVIRRLRFPKPRGGGLVRIRYPFVFKSAGGAAASAGGARVARPPPRPPRIPRRPPAAVVEPRLRDLPFGSCRSLAPPSAVLATLGKIKSCYAAALSRNPALAGQLRVQYATDKQGTKVALASATGIADPALRTCVSAAVVGATLGGPGVTPSPHSAVCTISLRNANAPPRRFRRIDISPTVVRIGEISLIPTRRLTLGSYSQSVVDTLAIAMGKTDLADGVPLTVRVDPRVDLKALDLVLLAAAKHGRHVVRLVVELTGASRAAASYVELADAESVCRGGSGHARASLSARGLNVYARGLGTDYRSTSALYKSGVYAEAAALFAKQPRLHVAVRAVQGMNYRGLARTLAAVRSAGVREISYTPAALR